MVVRTDTDEIETIRRITLELLLADHPGECVTCAQNLNCELQELAAELGVDSIRFRRSVKQRPRDESNPFFVRDPDKCILCGRCVQTCQELQGVGAVDFLGRGDLTIVDTFGHVPLADSPCESCGECVSRCPSGALTLKGRRRPEREVKTTCTYCGVGCSLYLGVRGGELISARADPEGPANRGSLCVKGRFGYGFVHSPDRLTKP